jgi:hypothetical protein
VVWFACACEIVVPQALVQLDDLLELRRLLDCEAADVAPLKILATCPPPRE